MRAEENDVDRFHRFDHRLTTLQHSRRPGLDFVDHSLDELLAVLLPVAEPAGDAILRRGRRDTSVATSSRTAA